jgi:hypothetical protein
VSLLVLALVPSARAQACDRAADVRGVVINELLADPASTDTGYEWVELKNGSGGPADLSGWVIASGTSSFATSDPFPAGTRLAAGALLVVGQPLAEVADLVVEGFSLGNASSNADAVQLRDCVGGAVDTIVYGAPNDDGWVGDRGDDSLAPKPPSEDTLGRLPSGRDTDDNATDVVALPYPSPGRDNDAPAETCGGPGSGFVVNEIFADPEGSDTGYEWVELLHTGRDPIDLAGWSLVMGTSSLTKKHTWEGGQIRPGERLLVGGAYVPGVDLVVESTSLGNATSNADVVAILDCRGFPSDTLLYGGPNDDGFLDDSGEVGVRLAPAPGENTALQRAIDGRDTDDNATDWVTTLEPSPGAENPEVEPVVCVADPGTVRINEFVSDPDGADEGLEWLELHNAGAEAVSVAGWSLSFGTSDFDSHQVTLGGGIEIPAGGFLLIGGEAVEAVDVLAAFSIGNGTETDGIRLFDCAGEVVDTVLYGDAPNADQLPDDAGDVVDPYGDPGSAEALARVADGVDTDSADDWKEVGIVTPGASNVRELGTIEDPLAGGPSGCGKQAPPDASGSGPAPGNPDGGCDTGGSRNAPLAALLLALGWARRRPTA